MTIAERAIWARSRLGLTQEQVAQRARVSQGTIGNLESGLRKHPRELLAIAAALQVRPEWLLHATGGPDLMTPPQHVVAQEMSRYGNSLPAHAVSQRQAIVGPRKLVWEDLMIDDITGQFILAIQGDALAPHYLPGQAGIWEASATARPGQPVLLADAGGCFYMRLFEPRAGGTWAGVSERPGHRELTPEDDAVRVVARMTFLGLD